MEPTIDQLKSIRDIVGRSLERRSLEFTEDITWRTIEQWEAIRPSDADQLQRTNHALAEELAAVKQSSDDWRTDCIRHSARVAEVEKERDKLKAMLPEWIPVTKGLDHEVVALDPISGRVANYCMLSPQVAGFRYYIEHETLANLPKREPAPKPTAEEIMRQEFDASFEEISQSQGIGILDDDPKELIERVAWQAWQAAKGGKP